MSFRCRHCRSRIREDEDTAGARCPRCLEPLFERPRVPEPAQAGGDADEGVCALHPHNRSVSTCRRCGNYMCPVCWTRWHGLAICTACVERALESREAAPEEARRHLRQAILALVFGLAAWAMVGLSLLIALMFARGGMNLGLAGLLGILVMVSPLVGALGIGQGAAAIRTRGDHMIL